MILLDTTLLLYAFRPEFPEHPVAREWLDIQLDSGEPIVLHPLATAAFLRLATKRLASLPPAPMDEALKFLAVLEVSATRLAEHSAHGKILARVCLKYRIHGDEAVDAWLAAFAIAHGLTLASHDRGFSRFAPELDWLDPLDGES